MGNTMRAVSQERFGAPEELRVVEVARPEPLPTEVLVRVRAAGINPVDWKSRQGHGVSGMFGGENIILGWDVSGVVEAVGAGVTRFAVGDEVYGMPWFPRPARAYAEYVTAPSRHFAPKPANLDHVHAAALPLAGLTAWQALVDTANVQSGQRVLVHAAAGGVGHLAVQIAKARGAHVIGTASAGKHEFLRGLGVDELVDYTTTDFTEVVSDVDVVVDLIGGDYALRSLRTLKPGGLLVVVPSPPDEAVLAAAEAEGKRATWVLVEPDHAALAELTALAEAGRLQVEVNTALPLEEAAQAHKLGETGRTRGKLVLTV
ncbi:NADPH:quinone reductase-like Zn-dependent oxidoreductase [Crossiella equi]|uniref:NADPH:quinone reductase-like Zn-dependent oxidoreductase n=2 Tax=Crossiella equi TaxID=130796 RepID=A0ABS5A7P7_9PSEU|nr:NADPH:quinone reductase-like Zn-dependent oxidoreductase [Crossiella equi]